MYQPERPLLPAFVTLGLVGALATAHAQTPASHANGSPAVSATPRCFNPRFGEPITRVYVPDIGARFHLAVPLGKVSLVRLDYPEPLSNVTFTAGGVHVEKYSPHSVLVTATAALKPGDARNAVLQAGTFSASMEVTAADMRQPAPILELVVLPAQDFERHKADALAKEAERARERDPSIMRDYRHGTARKLLLMTVQRPSSPRMVGLGAPVAIRYAPQGEVRAVLTRLLEYEGYRYLEVVLDNRRLRKLEIESAWIAEGHDDAIPVDVALDETARAKDGLLAIIPVGRTTRGVVPIPADITTSLDQLRVGFRSPGVRVTEVVAQEVVELWPRMPEHIAKRRRWAKQVAVSVRGVYGGFWTGDGLDGTEASDGTSAGGLAVRFTQGFFHNVAFEAEIVGGKTATVRFEDAEWRDMQGTVERRASFGRVQAFGVLRSGGRYVISTRLGVGVQGTDYASAFTTGDTTMDGPGGSFEIDGVWSVGASFDARMGERWIFGSGFSFARTFGESARSLEAGIQLGYRWSL